MIMPLGFGWVSDMLGCVISPCPTSPTAMKGPYTFDGILMFQTWNVNIPQWNSGIQKLIGGQNRMSGESRRSFAVAIASFVIGAAVATVLGNPKNRERLNEASKTVTKKLQRRNDVA